MPNYSFLNRDQFPHVPMVERLSTGTFKPGDVLKVDSNNKYISGVEEKYVPIWVAEKMPGTGMPYSGSYTENDTVLAYAFLPGVRGQLKTTTTGNIAIGQEFAKTASGAIITATTGKQVVARAAKAYTGLTGTSQIEVVAVDPYDKS